MAVPILLVTGFLGAGKTTLINHLLTEPNGRRLAAVVNDFGAIDIDAALLASVGDDIVSLKNGCICCSLQGDLLRTLSTLLRRDPAPDGIVIETSGVSDPAEIVRSLLDPVIWQAAALDAVICVADARHLTDRPDLLDDALCQSQLRAADFVALNKTDLVTPAELETVRQGLTRFKPARVIQDTADGHMPPDLLFSAGLHQPEIARPAKPGFSTPGFPERELDGWSLPCRCPGSKPSSAAWRAGCCGPRGLCSLRSNRGGPWCSNLSATARRSLLPRPFPSSMPSAWCSSPATARWTKTRLGPALQAQSPEFFFSPSP